MASAFATFHATIALQLQIDFALGGLKIASALLRRLTRKALPELCLVPPKISSLRGSLHHSRLRPQRNGSFIPKIPPHVCDEILHPTLSPSKPVCYAFSHELHYECRPNQKRKSIATSLRGQWHNSSNTSQHHEQQSKQRHDHSNIC